MRGVCEQPFLHRLMICGGGGGGQLPPLPPPLGTALKCLLKSDQIITGTGDTHSRWIIMIIIIGLKLKGLDRSPDFGIGTI